MSDRLRAKNGKGDTASVLAGIALFSFPTMPTISWKSRQFCSAMKKHIDSLCRIIRDHITSPLTSQLQAVKQAVIQTWRHTRERTRQDLDWLHVQALKSGITIFYKLQGCGRYFSYGIVSIAGALLAGVLILPQTQAALRQFQNYHDVFIAAGGLIGTMLALVFSLSIIPVQRAVETFTASISRLYREGTPAQFIFVILAVFSLFSFMMAVNGIAGFHGATLFPVQIVLLGIALDLLRWHHRRVSQLLEPREAVNRLYQQIARHIDRTQRLVTRAARIQWRAQSPEHRASRSPEMMESGIYSLFPNSYTPVNNGTSELTEIALKAIARGETRTAEVAIAAMTNVARHYLDRRTGNLILIPSAAALFLVAEGDVKVVLTPIYDRLMDINRNAVSVKAETTCIHVISALGSIASYTASLKAAAFPTHEAPLTPMPIHYLRKCVKLAQRHELDDAALEGSHVLLQVAQSAPDNV
jgi:hypothetical protein